MCSQARIGARLRPPRVGAGLRRSRGSDVPPELGRNGRPPVEGFAKTATERRAHAERECTCRNERQYGHELAGADGTPHGPTAQHERGRTRLLRQRRRRDVPAASQTTRRSRRTSNETVTGPGRSAQIARPRPRSSRKHGFHLTLSLLPTRDDRRRGRENRGNRLGRETLGGTRATGPR